LDTTIFESNVVARLLSNLFYNSTIQLACFCRFLYCAVEALSGSAPEG